MEAMVRRGVAYCPTLVGFEHSAGLATDYLEKDPGYALFGDEERTAWVKFKERGNATWSAQEIADSRASWENRREWIRRFRDLGGQVLVGTDTPFGGILIHRELALLAELGLTPLELISTATGRAAAAMHVADRIGTVETGKAADLVVVEGDPMTDLAALRNIAMVIQAGKVVHSGRST
jgi:imidazolonepropionase-like amidohydrolase